ncbi:hypothetical protein ACROYT_G037447 [Oculina patagonica]
MSSKSRKPEEELQSDQDQALEEANCHIKDLFHLLKRETNKLRQESEAFDEVAKKLEHVHFSKTLKLNVGGQMFSTSLETMKKDPGSMLHAMFSGRFDTEAAEDGCYFIDRDGTTLPLLTEAEFYRVEGIQVELNPPFRESSIMSSDQRQTLIKWLRVDNTLSLSALLNCTLLYRATRDGWAATNFHPRCDNKGPTVTVVRSGKYVFGGYTEQSWQTAASGVYKTAPNSFLFSLINPSGLKPTKMPLIQGKEKQAVYCNSGYGPLFGSTGSSGRYDLLISNTPNTQNSCQSNLNNSYRCPEGQNATTFLCGNSTFAAAGFEDLSPDAICSKHWHIYFTDIQGAAILLALYATDSGVRQLVVLS